LLDTENNSMSTNGKDYRLEIELLKKDVGSVSHLYERMEKSISKLETAANDLSKVSFEQDQRFKHQDTINEDMEKKLEKHIIESDERSKELNKKIESVDDKIDNVKIDLTQKIQQSQTTIVEEMLRGRVELRDEINKITENLNKKIGDIDMWRYMIMGGIALFVFLVGNMSGITKFFR
jgi:molecular chaperone GrpE (heat shock protein)